MKEFIVAEVSKNWPDPEFVGDDPTQVLCGKFEEVIEFNWKRGYVIHSFQFSQATYTEDGKTAMVETVIAVFRRSPDTK